MDRADFSFLVASFLYTLLVVAERIGLILFAFYDDFADDRHMTTDNNGHVSGHYYLGGVFTGIDVYLWKGLYCGAEVGLKAVRMKESQSSYTTASSAHTYVNAGFYCEPAIRVGWTF